MTWQEVGIGLTFLLGVWNVYFNIRNSRRTTFINTVTSERVKWIQTTREAISRLCGAAYNVARVGGGMTSTGSELQVEIDRLSVLAILQLNPDGALDKELASSIRSVPQTLWNKEKLPLLMTKIVEQSQALLKMEWEKVKQESEHGNIKKLS